MIDKLLLVWKWLAALALMGIALGVMTDLYLAKRDELTAFTAQVEQAARDATTEKERIEKRHSDNLEQVRKDHEARLPEIRAGAVANYRSHHRVPKPAASSGVAVPGDGPGVSLDDAVERQCVPDNAFIENAAEDAEKLDAWIDWCQRNNCPVKD